MSGPANEWPGRAEVPNFLSGGGVGATHLRGHSFSGAQEMLSLRAKNFWKTTGQKDVVSKSTRKMSGSPPPPRSPNRRLQIQHFHRKYISKNNFTPWDYYNKYNPDIHIKRGYLDTKDNVSFLYHRDALRCFGYDGGHFHRAVWSIKGTDKGVWCFQRSEFMLSNRPLQKQKQQKWFPLQ